MASDKAIRTGDGDAYPAAPPLSAQLYNTGSNPPDPNVPAWDTAQYDRNQEPQQQSGMAGKTLEFGGPDPGYPTGRYIRTIEGRPTQSTQSIQNSGTYDSLLCVLVLGGTGVGKSSFIATTFGHSQVKVGHGLDSCTSHCIDFEGPRATTLVDTPGFNDTNRPDEEVLDEIRRRILSDKLPAINAVLYLHRITDNRMTGSSLKNFELMREICGDHFCPRIVIATTMWSRVPEALLAQAYARETQLRTYWEPILTRHGRYLRFDGGRESGEEILDILSRPLISSSPTLQLGLELNEGIDLMHTRAGLFIQKDKLKRQEQLQRQLKEEQNRISKGSPTRQPKDEETSRPWGLTQVLKGRRSESSSRSGRPRWPSSHRGSR